MHMEIEQDNSVSLQREDGLQVKPEECFIYPFNSEGELKMPVTEPFRFLGWACTLKRKSAFFWLYAIQYKGTQILAENIWEEHQG